MEESDLENRTTWEKPNEEEGMICANCGQKLPKNGVCYNCRKNVTDAKHYGQGRGRSQPTLSLGLVEVGSGLWITGRGG